VEVVDWTNRFFDELSAGGFDDPAVRLIHWVVGGVVKHVAILGPMNRGEVHIVNLTIETLDLQERAQFQVTPADKGGSTTDSQKVNVN